jgi:predicted naringenin-chalcone synthase
VFDRMAERSGIGHRWSVLPPAPGSPVEAGGFYHGRNPSTAERMAIYAEEAPTLALAAIEALRGQAELGGITHLVVASCTGFVAPGIDQIIARELGLPGDVERTLVGFMGCYAAVSALRTAYHIVRSEPEARVLAVTVELSTLHLQYDEALEPLLAMLQFGDGAAAMLVIGDNGFVMQLSGEVPGRIAEALREPGFRAELLDEAVGSDAWAVHAGGRSVLDAVEQGIGLPAEALAASRDVLARFGNMSSSTLPFVLAELLDQPEHRRGVALAFGPGLAAEGFRFRRAP